MRQSEEASTSCKVKRATPLQGPPPIKAVIGAGVPDTGPGVAATIGAGVARTTGAGVAGTPSTGAGVEATGAGVNRSGVTTGAGVVTTDVTGPKLITRPSKAAE